MMSPVQISYVSRHGGKGSTLPTWPVLSLQAPSPVALMLVISRDGAGVDWKAVDLRSEDFD